jgi:serine/threonine protein kinase
MTDDLSAHPVRPDDSMTSPAWAVAPSPHSADLHDAVTADTPATGGDANLIDYGSGLGRSVGKFNLLKRLGSGGNGQVYAALHTELGKTVALKFFRAYAAAPPQLDAMRREAQTLASLRHPGIVRVEDFQVHEVPRADAGVLPGSPPIQIPYIVMEYIPSELTLGMWARSASPDLREILRVGAAICDAVEHAHEKGIIHRDIKPGNILIDFDPQGAAQPRVIDFGLSQLLAGWGTSPAASRGEFDRVTGTLQYMSPEQLSGNPMLVDHRSDVYALGVVLYELLCGRLPYVGSVKLTGELTYEIRKGTPVRPSTVRPELAGPIEDVLLRALQKDPARRHQRAGDLADDLRRILNDQPLGWRPEPVRERAGRTARALTRRSRVIIALCAAVLGTLVSFGAWTYALWSPMSAWYERLAGAIAGDSPITSIDNVRIVEIRDGADLPALARGLGVEGVTGEDRFSTRRLHGRMFERLAICAPRAVVLDLHYSRNSEHDAAFARGVKMLNDAGIDVVVGVKTVRSVAPAEDAPPGGTAGWSPVIADGILASGVKWGYIQINIPPGRPLSVPLVTRQAKHGYIPSLSMSAISAARWPRAQVQYEAREEGSEFATTLDPSPPTLYVRATGGLRGQDAPAALRASAVGPWENYPSLGFASDDECVSWTVPWPERSVFEAAVRGYDEVLLEPDETLRAWARDKIILIGDARRESGDRGRFGPFDDAPYVYPHALAIEALSKEVAMRYPTVDQLAWSSLLGALIGAVMGFVLHAMPRTQLVAALGASLVITSGAVLLYAKGGIIANPFFIVAALLVAMGFTAGLGRLARIGALPRREGATA